mgnify:FL=1
MKNIFIFTTLLLTGFVFGQELKPTTAGQKISVSYPSSYVKSWDLHDDAMLQMSNSAAEKYNIIIQDEKAGLQAYQLAFDNMEEAIKFYSKGLVEGLEKSKTSKISTHKIGNNNIAEMTIEGFNFNEETEEKTKIFYLLTLVETPSYYYQILSWTLWEYKDKYLNEFKNIASTFKEVD